MTVRLIKPLYADSANGKLRNIGVYTTINGKSYLITDRRNKAAVNNLPKNIAGCMKNAKILHSQIPKTLILDGGQFVWRIIPKWGDYWRQYLIDNPECTQ